MREREFKRPVTPEEAAEAISPVFVGFGMVSAMAGLNPLVGISAAMTATMKLAGAANSFEKSSRKRY